MFDLGFWELMLIGIISLVVLGPDRLPVAIRTVKGWINTVKKLSESVKSEITEELRINELHSNLKKAEQLNMSNLSPDLAKSVQSLKEAAAEVTRPYEKITNPLNTRVNTTNHSEGSVENHSGNPSDNSIQKPVPIVFDGQVEPDNIKNSTYRHTIDSQPSAEELKIKDKQTHE
jgi:sec-independent protein translocase protein TatB